MGRRFKPEECQPCARVSKSAQHTCLRAHGLPTPRTIAAVGRRAALAATFPWDVAPENGLSQFVVSPEEVGSFARPVVYDSTLRCAAPTFAISTPGPTSQ